MFKKNLKAVIAVMLICVMACSLTACATKLSGTYTSDGIIEQSFTFKEDGELLDQTFSNQMPAFAEQYYSKSKWTTDKMKKWLELNGFAY